MIGSRLLVADVLRAVRSAQRPALWLSLLSATAIASAQAPTTTPPAPAAPAAEPAPAEDVALPEPEATEAPAEAAPAEPSPESEAAPELEPAPETPPPGDPGVAPTELTLDGVAEEANDSAPEDWTQPVPVLTLHGYMRVRGEIQDTFWLGRGIDASATYPDPFTPYRSSERAACAMSGTASATGCDIDTLSYATMRLRLSPELNLSDDVRVKMTFDAFDNVIAGSGPSTFYDPAFGRTYASTLQAGTVVVRRAWAEVRNRSLGELRFGRMPAHWGLGMVQNSGNRLDDDLSTEVDRLMAITKLAGLYLTAAYDFTGEGPTRPGPGGVPLDASQRDDVDQFSFSVSQRMSKEEEEDALARGDMALQAGGMFTYRLQDLALRGETLSPPPAPADSSDPDPRDELVGLDASSYTFDGWAQLKWRGLRVEVESALVVGSVQNTMADGTGSDLNLLQFGTALETELRLLDDKLGLYFNAGVATGDPEGNGLSSDSQFVVPGDSTMSTFRFHPTYRVDLILWRNLMQQVTGAYYFKPGISYDFARDPFGQLLGARVDLIWSRAVFTGQTWGGDPDLGVEINGSLYWRGEDGPELDDGFHAIVQYGILFPMQGLWYRSADAATSTIQGRSGELQTAQTVRLILGVVY